MTNLTVEVPIGLKGFFKLIRRNGEDESIVEETDWMPNMVLNTGLNYIGGFYVSSSWDLRGCHVGSSNAAVSAGQTGMQAFVAGVSTPGFTNAAPVSSTAYPNVYTELRGTWRFGVGVAAGNLAEVGIAIGTASSPPTAGSAGNSAQPCFSRALIVDGGGIPTTLTVLPTEILDVVYAVRLYGISSDLSGTFTVVTDAVPINYSFTFRPSQNSSSPIWANTLTTDLLFNAGIGSGGTINTTGSSLWDGAIGAVMAAPSGAGVFFSTVTNSTYVSGNYFRDGIFTAAVGIANFGTGISALKFNFGVAGYQMSVSPAIPKINTQQFVITIRITWANLP